MKLVSCVDFVLEQRNIYVNDRVTKANVGLHVYLSKTSNYANFLKLPLQLGFFVPCFEGEEVIFEGFELIRDIKKETIRNIIYVPKTKTIVYKKLFFKDGEIKLFSDFNYIQDLVKYNLTINENAIKKYNL